ncbi:uncharacterized protein LOC144144858 [Haemaphysalis longicornis]
MTPPLRNEAPAATASLTSSHIILSHPRDPPFFYGTANEDVEDWIKMYERVSAHNRWHQTIMLANLSFCLKGTAQTWFIMNEARLTSLDSAKEDLKAIFGTSASGQLTAKNNLASRVQSPNESYVAYILDVLAPCQKVDHQMSEEDKVRHILKGIADDAFNLLVFKNCDKGDAPREPPSFRGAPVEDPEEWLEKLERVRIFNRWDDDETFRHVFFYLEDAARTWFETHESSLTDWIHFKREFLKTFTTVVKKERAALLLETRTEHPNEGVVIFVEEMKQLFRRADPEMTEEKKLRFLMRGVKEELFNGLVRNPQKTVAEFVTEGSTIEKALEMRAKQYDRNYVGMANANCVDNVRIPEDSLRETILEIVRELLRKLLPTPPQPQVASLTDVIREEVQQALGTSTTPVAPREPQAMTYAAAVHRPRPPAPYRHEAPYRRPLSPARPPAAQPPAPRKTDVSRTSDNRPLCYHCGDDDHVYRRCPYRRLGLRGFSVKAPRPRTGQRPSKIEEYLSNTNRRPMLPNRCNLLT